MTGRRAHAVTWRLSMSESSVSSPWTMTTSPSQEAEEGRVSQRCLSWSEVMNWRRAARDWKPLPGLRHRLRMREGMAMLTLSTKWEALYAARGRVSTTTGRGGAARRSARTRGGQGTARSGGSGGVRYTGDGEGGGRAGDASFGRAEKERMGRRRRLFCTLARSWARSASARAISSGSLPSMGMVKGSRAASSPSSASGCMVVGRWWTGGLFHFRGGSRQGLKLHLTRASSRQRCPPTCPRTNPQPFDSSSQTSQRASPSIVPRYNNCRNSFPATPSKACPRPPTTPPAHPCPQTSSPSSSRSAATSSSQPIESAKVLLSLLFSPPSQSLAITGHAQQWGSVKTKKDKKPPTPSPKDHPASRDRTDSHGGRGGRGRGRGGPTRGARGRGSPRTGPGVNGHASRSPHPGKTSSPAPDSADRQPVEDFSDPVQPDKHDSSDGILSAPNDSPSDPNHTAGLPASDPSIPPQSWSTPSSWGASPWGAQDHSASAPPTSSQPISAAQRPTKLPATSKLSWAQIARSEISVLLYPPFPPHTC